MMYNRKLIDQIHEKFNFSPDAWEAGTGQELCKQHIALYHKIKEVREQIQEDIITFCDGQDEAFVTALCQIVCDQFAVFRDFDR